MMAFLDGMIMRTLVDAMRVYKVCGCGRAYSRALWLELELIGFQPMTGDPDGKYLEQRNCVCTSTMSVEVELTREIVASANRALRDARKRIADLAERTERIIASSPPTVVVTRRSGPPETHYIDTKVLAKITPGDAVRLLRELHDLTQTELAEKAGIAEHAIQAIENGTETLGRMLARRLASVLKVDLSVLTAPVTVTDQGSDFTASPTVRFKTAETKKRTRRR